MKFKLGKVQIDIKRHDSRKKKQTINEDYLLKLNNDYLDYIKKISKEEIEQRIRDISVKSLSSNKNMEYAKLLLKENGIIVVPNFLETEIVNTMYNANKSLFKEILEIEEKSDGYYEDEHIVIQSKDIRIKGYMALSSYKKTVVNIRQGQDQGMIDIFNVDKSKYYQGINILDVVRKKKELQQLVSGLEIDIKVDNINLYHNNSITKTRGFHMDDLSNTLKAFIYLTDVDDLSNGPYCYVNGTHKPGPYREANLAIASKSIKSTEAPYVPMNSIVPILAQKGSLVISDQTGIHRGIPQKENFERTVLVARYK